METNKPEYRIRVIIEDVNTGEEVVMGTGPVFSMDEDTAQTAYTALHHFHNKFKAEHEATHYPSETEE